jgi:hypothetical protein
MKIQSYIEDTNISLEDKVTGTDADDANKTKNYTFRNIVNFLKGQSIGGATTPQTPQILKANYVRGFEDESELGNSVNIGKGKGKIRLTNGSNAFTGIEGADFTENTIGSIGYSSEFTIVLPNKTRRYIYVNVISDSTNGTVGNVYLDNQYQVLDGAGVLWNNPSGDYEYYPYTISSSNGDYSFSEGMYTQSNGLGSHAEGRNTQANGDASHAEGRNSKSNGTYSHAEGYQTIAAATASHAEGYDSHANEYASHAEGNQTRANGISSHSGGFNTKANGVASFVHGQSSEANGENTIVLGANIIGDKANTTYIDRLSIKTRGSYANDAAADADVLLASGGVYTLIGSRVLYVKP